MLSQRLMWEPTPPGGVHLGEKVLHGPQLYNEHSHLYHKMIAPGTCSPLSSP
jgi:hypothetical protein